MANRKRNEYLETEDSQEDESENDFELKQDSKISRAVKRRKISDLDENRFTSEEDEVSADSDLENGDVTFSLKDRSLDSKRKNGIQAKNSVGLEKHIERNRPNGRNSPDGTSTGHQDSRTQFVSSESIRKPKNKTGVIYLSRVPPFMKPATVRNLLSPYGEISRIFLTPESPTSRSARVRQGGNKKRSFVDGWVEFVHKSHAKLVAETLNANIIGGKKGGYYHDDVWNIKYLKGFKWADLTEQIKNENAERAARLRMEISQTTRENKRFIEGFEKAKMLERMEGKRKAREVDGQALSERRSKDGFSESRNRKPLQNGLDSNQSLEGSMGRQKKKGQDNRKNQPEEVQKVLSMIM